MKIAFFGTGEFSSNILSGILDYKNIEVCLVISQPDKPTGRKQELLPTPVKLLALEKGIEVLQPSPLTPLPKGEGNLIQKGQAQDLPLQKQINEFYEKLKSLNLDFIVVVAYGKIIPVEILEIPKYGCINIHGSILPFYRGASPIQEAIKNGDKKTGLTIMYMSEKMDEGDILNTKEVEINILDKTPDIFKKFENIGVQLLLNTLNGIIEGNIKGISQDYLKATYCLKIKKENGKIDFENETVLNIYNKFRAYFPWPGIYSYYKGKKIQITDCFFKEKNIIFNNELKLGNVIKFEKEVGILCMGGILILNKIKLEGKKEMNIDDFINGNKDFLKYNFC